MRERQQSDEENGTTTMTPKTTAKWSVGRWCQINYQTVDRTNCRDAASVRLTAPSNKRKRERERAEFWVLPPSVPYFRKWQPATRETNDWLGCARPATNTSSNSAVVVESLKVVPE